MPSLLEANRKALSEQLLAMAQAGIQQVHVDIMDGKFVPLASSGIDEVRQLKNMTSLGLDVHLMVETPADWIEPMIEAGVDSVVFHVEACSDLYEVERLLKEIHFRGCEAGFAFNPETEPENIPEDVIKNADKILVMSVNPGRKGQTFRQETFSRIRKIRRRIKDTVSIEVDGGITDDNIYDVFRNGADRVVIGRALFQPDFQYNLRKFSELMNIITKSDE